MKQEFPQRVSEFQLVESYINGLVNMDDKSTVRDYTKQVYAQIDASSLDVSAVSRLKTMIAIAENSKFCGLKQNDDWLRELSFFLFLLNTLIMKQNKCLLVGLISLMFSINSLYAQKDSLNVSTNNESYKRVYILDVGLGIGFTGIQKNGSSSWYIGNNKNDVPFVSFNTIDDLYPYSNIGCGIVLL